MEAWLKGCTAPHVVHHRLAASFVDPAAFATSGPYGLAISTSYDIPFIDFIGNRELGPMPNGAEARKVAVNLLRQHWDRLAARRGLRPCAFASGEAGWFFPDSCVDGGWARFETPDGRKRRKVLSGKFRVHRWHLCLLAKPRLWPVTALRVHANLVLSNDGRTAIDGRSTHRLRRRLTRSWWNDKWRDMLLASMAWLAGDAPRLVLDAGSRAIEIEAWPISVPLDVSYHVEDVVLTDEETEEGEIFLDERLSGFDEEDFEEEGQEDE